MNYDICIIGGGAAGMMAAIVAKQKNPALNVLILERLSRVGKKLSLTGNGRCNITNRELSVKNYHGAQPEFVLPFFENFSVSDTERFFEKLGISIIYEESKGYPASLQAASVTDALRFSCDELGVVTECEQKVIDIQKNSGGFCVITDKNKFSATAVVVTSGLLSGGEKLGCDGSMLELLKKMGVSCNAMSPAIVQLKTDTEIVRQLKGIKVNAMASHISKNTVVREEFGEVLFCDYGLSGPPILQLAGGCSVNDVILLDLAPCSALDELKDKLIKRAENLKYRKNDEFLSGFINKRLGQVILKTCGISLNDYVSTLNHSDIEKICRRIKSFKATVRGHNGFANSQVTKGGLLCREFDKQTLMCKKIPGLFAAGEILDIDGDCGGYNLQWAWSSGYAVGIAAACYTEK